MKRTRPEHFWRKSNKTWTKHMPKPLKPSKGCIGSSKNTCSHGTENLEGPQNLTAKIWQMMQSNNTMSQNLETDFAEILERTHQLEWNGTAKAIRVLELIKANVRSSLPMESVVALVAEWISLGEMIRQIEGMAGQGDLVRDREPGVGRHDRRVDRVFLRRRQQSCLVNVNVLDLP